LVSNLVLRIKIFFYLISTAYNIHQTTNCGYMPDNQCTTEQFSVRIILHTLGAQDTQHAHLREDYKFDITNCEIKAKL